MLTIMDMIARTLVGVVLLVAACGGRSGAGAAWPSSAGAVEPEDQDGGESLDPQHASHVAAVERAEDKTPSVDETATVVVDLPAMPVEIPPLPTTADTKPAGEVEVIEIKPEEIEITPAPAPAP